MGRHGENIRHRKSDGRWEGRYKVYHEEKRDYVYRSVYGHTYDEVKEKLLVEKLTTRSVLSGGKKGGGSIILFSKAADEWLMYIREKCKYSTYIKYSTVYRIHLAHILGDCPLIDITSIALQSEIPEHLSENQQKSIYCVANQILRFASDHYLVTVPALTRITARAEKRIVETLSIAEQTKLLDCLYTNMDKYKIAVAFSLCLGLRLGEICALKWSDVDIPSMTMTVNHTVQRIAVADEDLKTDLLESDPKSGCSKRLLPITCQILHMLDKIQSDKPYIFGGEKPLEPRTMQYQFKRILKKAAIRDRNFHILRHTFATNCIEKGVDIKSLSELLGHSDVKITLNRYVHPTMDAKRLQLEQLIQFYDEIHGQAL
ncbi:MAG: site-specific integrase [Lachnospiraceae bacterium]|nr:site-specific integrase [Lachnospiraceae bacterium]